MNKLQVVLVVGISLTVIIVSGLSSVRRSRDRLQLQDDKIHFPDEHTGVKKFPDKKNQSEKDTGEEHGSISNTTLRNSQMSLDLARKLNEIDLGRSFDGLKSFIGDFVDNPDEFEDFFDPNEGPSIASRFGGGDLKSGKLQKAQHAPCRPEPALVSLEPDEGINVNAIYMPQCTRVPKCSGCCNHVLLECRPTRTQRTTLMIIKLETITDKSRSYIKGFSVPATVEEHLSCECGCAIKKEHCSRGQEYDAKNCKCLCPSQYEEMNCVNSGREWNFDTCSCVCEETEDCSTGAFFDRRSCSCVKR